MPVPYLRRLARRCHPCPTLCAGLTSISTGSGTITGDRIDGVLTFDYSNGVFETNTITNGAAGTDGTVVLRIPRASVSGAATGSCSIVPPAETVLSQTRADQSYHVGLLGVGSERQKRD